MPIDRIKLSVLLLVAAVVMVVAGCGGSSSNSSDTTEGGASETTGASGSVLGSPDKATGEPIVLGQINLENGPLAFPQVGEGADAAVEYVNNYLGGVHGRPLKIERCATDGQPATSASCANQLLEKEPLAILGAVDIGGTGSFPIWEEAGLAYLGGSPFTPVEANAKNAAVFMSLNVGDNAAAVQYAKEEGLKSAVLIQVANVASQYVGAVIRNEMEGAGIKVLKTITVPETTSDLSAPAAEVVSSDPELVYIQIPASCPQMLQALQQVGNTAQLMGVDPCVSPAAIEAAGGAAEGLITAGPFEGLESGSEDMEITLAAMKKYAPEIGGIESNALGGFNSVMNTYEKLNAAPVSVLSEPSKVLGLFKEGSENPNWLAHPYTCDGKQVPAQASVCNGYQKIKQVKDGESVVVSEGWVTGVQYLDPSKLPG